jgi:hypothetical protein
MNPIKYLWHLLKDTSKFIYTDLKTDIKFIIHVFKSMKNNKPILREDYKKELKDYFSSNWIVQTLKDNWLLFFLLALFFFAGYWWAMQRCAETCNSRLIEIMTELTQKSVFNHAETQAANNTLYNWGNMK